MAQLYKALGRNREFPMLEGGNIAGSAANSNFEHPLALVPNITALAGAGQAGDMPAGAMRIRAIYLIAEAVLTGANTNTVTLNIRQWRNGAALGTNIATVAFTSGTNLAVMTPYLLTPTKNNSILPGDVITVQTVNAGTGLATPAMSVLFDWEVLPANVV